jgi:hypothetical protein
MLGLVAGEGKFVLADILRFDDEIGNGDFYGMPFCRCFSITIADNFTLKPLGLQMEFDTMRASFRRRIEFRYKMKQLASGYRSRQGPEGPPPLALWDTTFDQNEIPRSLQDLGYNTRRKLNPESLAEFFEK